jgi:hypothetical protein
VNLSSDVTCFFLRCWQFPLASLVRHARRILYLLMAGHLLVALGVIFTPLGFPYSAGLVEVKPQRVQILVDRLVVKKFERAIDFEPAFFPPPFISLFYFSTLRGPFTSRTGWSAGGSPGIGSSAGIITLNRNRWRHWNQKRASNLSTNRTVTPSHIAVCLITSLL